MEKFCVHAILLLRVRPLDGIPIYYVYIYLWKTRWNEVGVCNFHLLTLPWKIDFSLLEKWSTPQLRKFFEKILKFLLLTFPTVIRPIGSEPIQIFWKTFSIISQGISFRHHTYFCVFKPRSRKHHLIGKIRLYILNRHEGCK